MKRKMIIGAVALFAFAGAANAQGFADAKFGIKGDGTTQILLMVEKGLSMQVKALIASMLVLLVLYL
ncbi:hypothetical protein [Niabella ginsengisoli]|uniref:Uncharacterized protein n=1 Tax=Niabella ginsengisoli TaxID=522298 RepID=A0ABS9SFV4_9BACT|nr:hypothetical protein [Niabella ginsengisoli]MCH5597241.1 hypothetical protein [Niabella ginsengisoli]